MGRIKGVNSDYQFIGGKIMEVDPLPEEVELKIFFCPYNQPSSLESEENYCEGTDENCPNENGTSGHALVHLHQTEGIKLTTDGNNHIAIDQAGHIRLCPTDAGRAEVNGTFVIKRKDAEDIFLKVSEEQIILEVESGAKVIINETGKIDLFTKNNMETVTVHGHLHVTGDLNVDGSMPVVSGGG